MTVYCHHHPLEAAIWIDSRHGVGWCRRCVETDPADGRHARSRLGQADLTPLPVSSGEAPFWDQLATFLLMPLQLLPLGLMIVATAVLSVMALGLPAGFWVAAAASGFVCAPLAGALMQGVVVRKRGSRRHWQSLTALPGRSLLELAVTLSVTSLVSAALVVYCPDRWVGVGVLLQGMLVPAFMLASAMGLNTGSPLSAAGQVMRTVGPAWALVVLFSLVLAALQSLLVALFWGELPQAWSVPVIIAGAQYGVMVLSSVLGAVQRQYAEGFDAGQTVRASSRTPAGRDHLHDSVETWARQGDFFEVERSLWKAIKQRPAQMTWQDELIRLLELRHDRGGMQAWLDQYLREILRAGDRARLMLLYNSRLRGSQALKPSLPDLRVELARALRQQGNPEEATGWLLNLHHEFPAWPGVADAYALLIDILCEDLGRPELARPSALYILEKYPQYRQRTKIEALLKGPH